MVLTSRQTGYTTVLHQTDAFPRVLWPMWNPALNLFELKLHFDNLHYTTGMQKKFQAASCSSTFQFGSDNVEVLSKPNRSVTLFKYKTKETLQKHN